MRRMEIGRLEKKKYEEGRNRCQGRNVGVEIKRVDVAIAERRRSTRGGANQWFSYYGKWDGGATMTLCLVRTQCWELSPIMASGSQSVLSFV